MFHFSVTEILLPFWFFHASLYLFSIIELFPLVSGNWWCRWVTDLFGSIHKNHWVEHGVKVSVSSYFHWYILAFLPGCPSGFACVNRVAKSMNVGPAGQGRSRASARNNKQKNPSQTTIITTTTDNNSNSKKFQRTFLFAAERHSFK